MTEPLPSDVYFRWQIVFRTTDEEFRGKEQRVQTIWLETDAWRVPLRKYPVKDIGLMDERIKGTFIAPGLLIFISYAVESLLLMANVLEKPAPDQKRIIENFGKQMVRTMKKMVSARRRPGRPRKADYKQIVDAVDELGENATQQTVAERLNISIQTLQNIVGDHWEAILQIAARRAPKAKK
jgi:hypothetical protein